MPWNSRDYPPAFKNLTDKQRRKAIAIANAVLRDCLSKGGTDKECAAKAIRIALAKTGGRMEETLEEAEAWKLNNKAYRHAVQLIKKGQVTDAAWSAPTLQRDFDGDIETWSLFHLAVNPGADPELAGSYGYPYGKNGKVYIAALRAIRAAAAGGRGARPNQEIFDAAGRLLDMVRQTKEEVEVLGESIEENFTWTVPLAEAEIREFEEGGKKTLKALVTLIKAGWSKNGRYYPRNVLAKAARLFERVGSFDGHLKNPKVSDYVGWFEDVRFDGERIVADFHIFDEKLARIVAHAPHLVGLSINGEGHVVRGEAEGRKGWLVEDIERANSVDVVVNPAAGGGINAILEAFNGDKEDRLEINTLAELKKAFPDLLEEYRQEIKKAIYAEKEEERNKARIAEAEKLAEELEALRKENEELKAKIAVFESREVLEAKLAESELPDVAKDRIRELFADRVAVEEDVDRVIAAEKEYLDKLAESVPVKGVKPEEDPLLEEHRETLKTLRKLFGIEEDK